MWLQHDGDGDHGVGQAGPEDGHENQRQQQRREGQDHVHDPHDDCVQPARREARDQPDQDAAGRSDGHDDDADEEGIARALDQTGQHIATQGVGPQREGPGTAILPYGGLQGVLAELRGWVIGRQKRCE